jgi:Glyoxalase/Bleomycin resistance protein/Dioxygenase superfamily
MLPTLHHIGYVVDELRAGAERFSAAFGAGPFFAMEHIVFDEVTFDGDRAVYDHSSAFGQWGPVIVELTQMHDAQPTGLRDTLMKPGAGIGHVAWLADSLEDEVARLESAGLSAFHTGRTGPASAVWLNAPLLGHPVEVLQRREELEDFYRMVRDAAVGWDGSDPLRILTGPPV